MAPVRNSSRIFSALCCQTIDGRQPQEAGCPLEGVHGPEYLVEQRQIAGILLQFEKVGLDGLQMLLGLDDKVGKNLLIRKFLAHSRFLPKVPGLSKKEGLPGPVGRSRINRAAS